MQKIIRGDTCPVCRQGRITRIRRRSWMRRLPASKHVQCEACLASFLTIYDLAIRLRPGLKDAPSQEK